MICNNCEHAGMSYCFHPQQWAMAISNEGVEGENCKFWKLGEKERFIYNPDMGICCKCERDVSMMDLKPIAKGMFACSKCRKEKT
jgi:hypothetical protein